jgi:glycosyltransferase involved in cell wall biosynthesis
MDEEKEPLVSICIPTYDGAQYLKECLDSALCQTLEDVEILVVDDQSPDDTLAIANGYAQRDARIRIEQNPHRLGLVGNWNRCLDLARGEWIKFLFQDDLLEPACLEKMLAAGVEARIPIIACRWNMTFENVDAAMRREYRQYIAHYSFERIFPAETRVSPERFREAVLDHLGGNFIGVPTAVLLHRSLSQEFGRFNPSLIQLCDLEYWLRVGVNRGIVYLPEMLVSYRVHPNAASTLNKDQRLYRSDVLDPAILFHEFVFHPLFAPLRAAAANRRPPIDLPASFAQVAFRALKYAEMQGDGLGDVRQRLADWGSVVAEYPRLQKSFRVRMMRFRRARALRPIRRALRPIRRALRLIRRAPATRKG